MTILQAKYLNAALMTALFGTLFLPAQQANQPRAINADMRQVKGPRNMAWRDCVGAGHAALLLREANQQQLSLVHKELGFEFIRFHGLFTDDMDAYKEVDGKPVYDWTKIDAIYGAIVHTGMKPLVELSFMPKDLASGEQTTFWWKANITPPKDFDKWGAFIEAFTRHLQQRFGDKEVAKWRFEVWNEPNLSKIFFTGDQAAYFHLYDVTVAAIKRVNPAYQVGGPATAGIGWIPDMIAHAAQSNVPLDFISTHTYGVDGGFIDEKGEADQRLSSDPDSIVGDMKKVHDQVAASTLSKLPIHFTEWNSSYSSRDPVHDTYLNAAFVLDKIKRSEGLVDSLSYWTYTDLFEEAGPPPSTYQGGFGLLTREGLRKATYYAYKDLNELGPNELENSDARSWLTKDGDSFAGLIWDFSLPKQEKSDKPFYRAIHPAADRVPVALHIAALKPGQYRLKINRTGYKANDAYTRYLEMGRPETPSAAQLDELRKLADEPPERNEIVSVGPSGVYETKLAMRENDIVFVALNLQK